MFAGSDGAEETFGVLRFSQEGEDGLLARIFETRSTGFYVDVGAHHPFRFSNTNVFYRAGWRGINIEANPVALALFEAARPRDINLQCLVAEQEGLEYTYSTFIDGALNTAQLAARDNLVRMGLDVHESLAMKARRLDSILDEHVKPGTEISFLSVDAEGFDLAILKSNDWSKYRPEVVLAEATVDLANPFTSPLVSFMCDQGYRFRSYLHITALFTRD